MGQHPRVVSIAINELPVDGAYIEKMLEAALTEFGADAPITLSFRKAWFASWHDLERFKTNVGVEVSDTDIDQ
jgi:hypothetical protein